MQRRAGLILAIVGLTAALAVASQLILRSRPGDDGEGSHDVRPIPAERASTAEPRPSDTESSTPSARGAAESLLGGAPATLVAGGADLVTVAIVRADTGEPVPQALVWHWSGAPFDSGGLPDWVSHGQAEDHLADAIVLRADAQGRVPVPRGTEGFGLMAASGELWGWTTFTSAPVTPAVLALAPDRDVRVRVTDRQGAPVIGAPVALQQRRGPASYDFLSARTEAPDGVARLRHAGDVLRAAAGESFVVAVQGLLDPPVEQPIAADAPPEQLVSLVLGPAGSCEVVVVDPDGRRLPGPLDASLRFATGGPGAAHSPQTATRRSRTGVDVVFEQVELGRTLAVSVRREGSEALLEASGPGPRQPGERVVLQVRVQDDLTILRGRLVDAQGTPAGPLTALARIETASGQQADRADRPLDVAQDGGFALDVADPPDEDVDLVLAIHGLANDGANLGVARRPLPADLTAGVHDLGDFVLLQPPLAVAGLVVDAAGRPVADATVTASPVELGSVEDGPALDPPPAPAAVHSDAQGRFEMFGELGPSGTALMARKDGQLGGPVVARPGERGVRIVLGATGGLSGTVLLDPSLQNSLMLVQVERSDGATEPGGGPGSEPALLGANGQFALRDLAPGIYRLGIVYAATGSELGAVDGLVVRAGDPTRDPRLQPLDLRAAGWLIELELVDEGGESVPGGRACSRPSGDPAARWSYASPVAGRLPLLGTGRPLDVVISAPSFLHTPLEQVTASQRVVLRRAARLSLRLAPGLRLPDPPLELGVELTPLQAGPLGGFVDAERCAFDETGALSCLTGFTGEVRVALLLSRRDRPAALPVDLRDQAPRVITVAEHPFEQQYEIRFEPASLAAAEEELSAER
jgi:hypothetical protein